MLSFWSPCSLHPLCALTGDDPHILLDASCLHLVLLFIGAEMVQELVGGELVGGELVGEELSYLTDFGWWLTSHF